MISLERRNNDVEDIRDDTEDDDNDHIEDDDDPSSGKSCLVCISRQRCYWTQLCFLEYDFP